MLIPSWSFFLSPAGGPICAPITRLRHQKNLGSDRGAYKISSEISKAWEHFSLHVNPAYTWGEDEDIEIGELNGGVIFPFTNHFGPALEYNYFYGEEKGHRQDIIAGLIWRFHKCGAFKVSAPMTVHSTFKDRDDVGIIFNLFLRY